MKIKLETEQTGFSKIKQFSKAGIRSRICLAFEHRVDTVINYCFPQCYSCYKSNEKQCFKEHSLNARITYQVDHDKSTQLKGYFASLPLNISK